MKIILWRLGSLEHKVYPNVVAVENFKHVLSKTLENDDDGERHIVWGPDIDVKVVDVKNLSFDKESFDIRALLTKNGVNIIESVKEVVKQHESNN